MAEFGQLAFGLFVVLGGALVAIDHAIADWLNRWMNSRGTTQRPEEIEMDENAAFGGALVGSLSLIVGLLVVDAVA